MSVIRRAFCPGHITAFFEICDEYEDPIRKGSRGAGISLSLGATSEVKVSDSENQEISIAFDGRKSSAEVTFDAIKYLINNKNLKIEVNTVHDLPIGQGFAMSAAGAISSCFALCNILDLPLERAFEASHVAEIKNGTGLGDVVGIFTGGIEIRLEPGLPPHGKIENIDISSELVLSVVGPPIVTRELLTDSSTRKKISAAGNRMIEAFREHSTLEHLFALGIEFVEETELCSPEVLEAIIAAEQHGMASMVMLGNSIFCVGKTEELLQALKPYGQTFVCEIDKRGPRLI